MRLLKRLAGICCIMAFSLVFMVAMNRIAKVAWYSVIIVPGLIGLIAFVSNFGIIRWLYRVLCLLSEKEALWRATVIVFFFVLTLTAFNAETELSWDWGGLINSASQYVLEGEVVDRAYFARYPNNTVWLSFLITVFRFVKLVVPSADIATFTSVSVVMSCLSIALTVAVIKHIACILWGSSWGLLVGMSACLYVPFYAYSSFYYSDTPALLIMSCTLLVYVLLTNGACQGKHRIVCYVLLGSLLGVLWKIKIMTLIVSIAMILDQALQGRLTRRLFAALAVGMVCFLVTGVLLVRFGDCYLGITDEERVSYEYPLDHWFMMTLNPDEDGGYTTPDDAYTRSFDTYDERKAADKKKIRERIDELGTKGLIRHVFQKKVARMWGDPTLGGSDYLSRDPIHVESPVSRLLSMEGGLHPFLLIYAIPVHLLLLAGLLAASFALEFSNGPECHMFIIALMGVFLFFLIWECNPRYLYVFSPVFLLTAYDGWHSLYSSYCRGACVRRTDDLVKEDGVV